MRQNAHWNFWPFEETEIKFQSATRMLVTTPWSKATISCMSRLAESQVRIGSWNNGKLLREDALFLSQALNSSFKFRNSYILPRALKSPALARPLVLLDSDRGAESPGQLIAGIGRHLADKNLLTRIASDPLMGESWKWNTESGLSVSQIPGTETYDPLTLLTICRRFHLLDSLETQNTFLTALREQNALAERRPDLAAYNAALVHRQMYHVTARCEDALTPALEIADISHDELERYIASERGHDKIMERGLTTLHLKPNDFPLGAFTDFLMSMFRVVAGRNFLGFILMLDQFEEPSNVTEHYQLLEKLKLHGTRQSLQHHDHVDGDGEHAEMSVELIKDYGSVSRECAIEAFRIAELASIIKNHWFGRLVADHFKTDEPQPNSSAS